MRGRSSLSSLGPLIVGSAVALAAFGARAAPGSERARDGAATRGPAASAPARVDRSGRRRVGVASVYAKKFAGRKMADGTRMDPGDDNAASKTLPLGTEARVTNLENGRSATVTIKDRGPYVKGRILDVSPGTAAKIGIEPKEGVAKVEVQPVAVPPPGTGSR